MSGRVEWWGDKGRAKKAAERGLRIAAEAILTESQNEVPLLIGTLERSGTVTTGTEGGKPVAIISYNTVYAEVQHERTDFHHPVPGRKAKYLEDPFNRLKERALQLVASEIRRAIE
jgi:hypothetical protein